MWITDVHVVSRKWTSSITCGLSVAGGIALWSVVPLSKEVSILEFESSGGVGVGGRAV